MRRRKEGGREGEGNDETLEEIEVNVLYDI